MDLYRIGSVEQVEDLGFDEYLEGDGLTVVEWADNVPGVFPDDALRVQLDFVSEGERRLTLTDRLRKFTNLFEAIQRFDQ